MIFDFSRINLSIFFCLPKKSVIKTTFFKIKGDVKMAMPHNIFKKKSVEELKSLSGEKKIEKVRELLEQMPNYKDGPYASIRKWLNKQKEKAFVSKKNFSHEQWEVKKQGDASFAFIGLPSVGKSSLIKAITNAQIEIASYEFTTKKPFSATTKIDNALIQLIDLPGIISGASQGKGFGKRVLGNAKNADKIVLVVESNKTNQIKIIQSELSKFGFELNEKNICIVLTKKDLFKEKRDLIGKSFPSVSVSIFDEKSIYELKKFLFKQSNLIRIKPFDSNDFVILKKGSCVKDYCEKIHNDLLKRFKYALLTGQKTKFARQRVGLNQKLNDLDEIELVLKH